MPRPALMAALLVLCALWLATPLLAQYNGGYVTPSAASGIYAPEIHLGSIYQPTTITVPPAEVAPATPPQPYVSNAPPASTEELASRHFDFITSPLDQVVPGSMNDTSISLGEYARQLRAEKQRQPSPAAPTPNAIASPTNSPNWK